MKMKFAISIVFILVSHTGISSAQSFPFLPGFAKAVVAGGFPDGATQGSQEGSDGTTLEDLKNTVGQTPQHRDGAARPVVGQDTMEAGKSDQLTDEFFTNSKRVSSVAFQRLLETAGYITSTFESYGQIVDGANSSQIAFGLLENVYVDKGKADGLRLDDKFWVMQTSDTVVNHPKTGDPIGVKVTVVGAIEIVEVADGTSKARIFRSFGGIRRGFKILPYDEREVPSIDPDKRITQKNVAGYLISGRLENQAFGQGDVVYFNVGESAGVEPGDVFDVIDSDMVTLADGSVEKGLPKIKGKARIIATREATSTALIVVSENVMIIGDEVQFAQERLP